MRAGHTHKTPFERSLASVRADTMRALDQVEDHQIELKALLTKVEKSLRTTEINLASGRLETGDLSAASKLDAPVLEYVKSVYTEQDWQVADLLNDIDERTVSSDFKKGKRGMGHKLLKVLRVRSSKSFDAKLPKGAGYVGSGLKQVEEEEVENSKEADVQEAEDARLTDPRRKRLSQFVCPEVDGTQEDAEGDMEPASSISTSSARPSTSFCDVLTCAPVAELLGRAGHFDFDSLAFHALPEVQNSPISVVGLHLVVHGPSGDLIAQMHEHDRFADCHEFESAITKFFQKIDGKYKSDALYHGSAHAVDVMSTMTWFLQHESMQGKTNPLESFMSLVASAIHDVGHMGRNNGFYTKTMHSLAIQYNDKSVLENMHLATSFEVMKEHEECNWFNLLLENSKGYVRKGLIDMVLATDPAGHAKHVKHFAELVQELLEDKDAMSPSKGRAAAEKQKTLDDKLLLLGTLLHAADVSNPTKPQHMMLGWTCRLLQEFWAQGDEERSLGFPISPLCDRESGMETIAKGQLGFVNFLILPFYKTITNLIPETVEAMEQLALNVTFWQGRAADGATYAQIFEKELAA